jgi:glycosyltransferase involved in cell wall biosynthesis
MTRQKHILALLHLPPPLHGAAIMNQRAIQVLQNHYRVTILPFRFSRAIAQVGRASHAKYVMALFYFCRLFWQLIRHRPDMVYFSFAPTGPAFWRDSLYALLVRLFGLRIVFHLHGRGLQALRDRSIMATFFQKAVFNNQTALVLGTSLRPELHGLNCEAAIVANCVDIPPLPVLAPQTPPQSSALRIVFLSNLICTKGIDTVINALAILKRQGMTFRFDIAGAPGDVSAQHLVSLLNEADIADVSLYHGTVDGNAKTTLLQNSDIMVFPSRYANEAQPLVVLEAMAHGIPVISSNIGTLGDIIVNNSTGFSLNNPADPQELASVIWRAHNQPAQRADMAKAARTLCETAFCSDIFAQKLRDIFARLL